MRKTLCALGLAAALAPFAAPTASAATYVTVYAQSETRTQYLFASNVAGKPSVGFISGGTALTGVMYAGGWFNITAGPNAGRWVWQPSQTPTAKPVVNTTRFSGTATKSPYYASTKAAPWQTTVKPLTAMLGDYYADGWFQERRTGYWLKGTLASNPYNAFETRQWQNTTGFKAMAPSDQTVTRYVDLNRTQAPVHSTTSYATSTITGRVSAGTTVTGRYVNSHWLKISSGANAGKYISSGVLYTQKNAALVNGKMKPEDLCAVPSALRMSFDVHDQLMACEALNQAVFLNKALATQGLSFKQWDAYRDYATQVAYKKQLGKIAATPGTSNHGLGNAADLRYTASGKLTWNSPIVRTMISMGPNYGWIKPAYLLPTGSNPEPWHFEFSG